MQCGTPVTTILVGQQACPKNSVRGPLEDPSTIVRFILAKQYQRGRYLKIKLLSFFHDIHGPFNQRFNQPKSFWRFCGNCGQTDNKHKVKAITWIAPFGQVSLKCAPVTSITENILFLDFYFLNKGKAMTSFL